MQRRAWGSGRGCSIIQVRDDSACLPGSWAGGAAGGVGQGVRAAGGETVRLRIRLRRDFEGRPKVQLKFWRKKRIADALFFKQFS